MNTELEKLVQSLPAGIHAKTFSGFDILLVKQDWGELALARHGAQALYFRPAGARPVLWLSGRLKAPPSPFRGGVPVCWPWFADAPAEFGAMPFHGVARTNLWDWSVLEYDGNGLRVHLVPEHALWPGLKPEIEIRVEDLKLNITLSTHNIGTRQLEITQALHTYLAVGDTRQIEVEGLEGCEFLDKVRDFARDTQSGNVNFGNAVDRIYAHEGTVEIFDPVFQRRLSIAKAGSGSTVVWNPGDAAVEMSDVGPRQQTEFVCVEAANTRLDRAVLAPGDSCRLSTTISIVT